MPSSRRPSSSAEMLDNMRASLTVTWHMVRPRQVVSKCRLNSSTSGNSGMAQTGSGRFSEGVDAPGENDKYRFEHRHAELSGRDVEARAMIAVGKQQPRRKGMQTTVRERE